MSETCMKSRKRQKKKKLKMGVEATTSNVHICFIPCSPSYGTYECLHDCLYKRYHDGNCVNGRCCCS
ncbi:putative defensin-like protein 57 [Brassica napus]|uniref:putative defensin-like protein 57 n=1 Tax=Brassica napus TaxID=3708 RepID=UPI000BBE80B3|nr:putative defensin-like protein 57 [Brassica napus]